MPTIKETRNSMIQLVFPEHANNIGTLHGGRLMDWIMLSATITSSRVAKGITVLGTTDSIDFLNPVKVGDIVVLDSWVEYVGTSSMEIGVKVHSENPEKGEKKLTTTSHLAFVAVDREGKPRPVPEKITPSDEEEESVYHEAAKRKRSRLTGIAETEKMTDPSGDFSKSSLTLETIKPVLPEDTFYGDFMSVGKLMKHLDETAAILARRYARGTVVTGSLDNLHFYSPIKGGDVINSKSRITYVGKTSVEVQMKVVSENTIKNELNHTCTAFLSFVHIDEKGRPKPVPPYTPETSQEKKLWNEAKKRKEERFERVKRIKRASLSGKNC